MSYQPPPPPSSGPPYPAAAYQSYGYPGYPPVRANPPSSLKGLSVALTVLLIVAAFAAVVAAITAFHRAAVTSDLPNRLLTSDLQDADDAVAAGVGFFGAVAIATGIVFMIWQFRHAKNAERLAGRLPLSAGWAIGGWFIPLGNYVLPELQLYQSAAASDPDAPQRRGKAPGVVLAWWILFVLAGLLFLIGRALHPSGSDVTVFNLRDKADQFAAADRIMAVGLLLAIPAAVAAILMVQQLSERQATALSRAPAQAAYPQPQPPYFQPPPSHPPAQSPPPPGSAF